MSPGMVATRNCESSSSRRGRGSHAGPWPGPVLRTLLGSVNRAFISASLPTVQYIDVPAPTKLYLPIVSVVAALSYKNDCFDLQPRANVSSGLPRNHFNSRANQKGAHSLRRNLQIREGRCQQIRRDRSCDRYEVGTMRRVLRLGEYISDHV